MIPGSHTARAAELMLRRKGIPYKRTDLPPVVSRFLADFQIATTLRLLMAMADLEPAIEGRPAAELARRIVPEPPGLVDPSFPEEWLAPLRTPAGAPAA